MTKLTEKQKRFVEEYLIDLNATASAIRAGYSVKNADNIGSELLGKTRVAAEIERARAAQARRTGVTADRVIAELAKIAFANITDVADLDAATMAEGSCRDDTAAIQSVKVKRIPTEDGEIIEREIKLYDKCAALDKLARHLGLYNDKMKLEGVVPVIICGGDMLED